MRLLPGLLVTVLVAVSVAGCAGATEPIEDPEVPRFSTPAPPGSTEGREVPATCAEVSSLEEIGRILNVLVTGRVLPIVGVPQDNIGRTARLDCYFGVPDNEPPTAAAVWIALASYTDSQSARQRISTTVANELDAGARASDVPVGDHRGVLLHTESTWMLVAARGHTTVVVTAQPPLVREDHAGAQLGQLANEALTPTPPT